MQLNGSNYYYTTFSILDSEVRYIYSIVGLSLYLEDLLDLALSLCEGQEVKVYCTISRNEAEDDHAVFRSRRDHISNKVIEEGQR